MTKVLFNDSDLLASLHPNTELSIDLKLFTRKPGRLPLCTSHFGSIARDDDEHFTFVENLVQSQKVKRHKPIFQGYYLNVNRDDHGLCRPHFKQIVLNDVQDIDQLVTHVCQELYLAWSCLEGDRV